MEITMMGVSQATLATCGDMPYALVCEGDCLAAVETLGNLSEASGADMVTLPFSPARPGELRERMDRLVSVGYGGIVAVVPTLEGTETVGALVQVLVALLDGLGGNQTVVAVVWSETLDARTIARACVACGFAPISLVASREELARIAFAKVDKVLRAPLEPAVEKGLTPRAAELAERAGRESGLPREVAAKQASSFALGLVDKPGAFCGF